MSTWVHCLCRSLSFGPRPGLQGWTGRGSRWRGKDLTWRHQSSRDRLRPGSKLGLVCLLEVRIRSWASDLARAVETPSDRFTLRGSANSKDDLGETMAEWSGPPQPNA